MKSQNTAQKIMYLNPVGFDAYDAFFAEMIRKNKFPSSEVQVTSLAHQLDKWII